MGVTIHYRGRLDDVGRVAQLCAELEDIADSMGWESRRLDDDWEQPADARLRFTDADAHIDGNLGLKGIALTGAGAEPASFFFDRHGNLRSPSGMVSILDGTLKAEDAWVFVKTQFASPEVHVWIVGLLKYVKKHYISNLEVSDEGQYWETGDVRILREKMDFIGRKLDEIGGDLSRGCLGDTSGLSADEIADRLEEYCRKKWGREAAE